FAHPRQRLGHGLVGAQLDEIAVHVPRYWIIQDCLGHGRCHGVLALGPAARRRFAASICCPSNLSWETTPMKAAYLETTGGPEVIKYGDLPTPQPKPGEVLVRVKAAALNPIDVYVRAGTVSMPLPKPFITGTDLAGVVEAVGPGIKQFKPGD